MGNKTCHLNRRKCQRPIIKKGKIIFCKPVIAFCNQLRSFSAKNRKHT